MNRIHRLAMMLEFPAGIAPGDGGEFNSLIVATNGQGRPVLRGTALAGALRSAWRRHVQARDLGAADKQVERFFGRVVGDDESAEDHESPLQVADCVLDLGGQPIHERTHHLRNRHTGSVAGSALYSLETCAPGTRAHVVLWLRDDQSDSTEAVLFLRAITNFLSAGLTLGGKTARGIGLALLSSPPTYRQYELNSLDEHAAYLDDHRDWRNHQRAPLTGEAWSLPADDATDVVKVVVKLAIPRGQDILIGDGQGVDAEIEPQRVVAANGQKMWRLPGSSLRGLFRSWMTRLAAREGKLVADNAALHSRRTEPHLEYNGANLGWCFLPLADRQIGLARSDCPIASLFGTLFQAGRIHISDAFAPCSRPRDGRHDEEQQRMHVAVDRITGGAAESMLFSNTVLTALPSGESPSFVVTILIREPNVTEIGWLAKTLKALNLGILRIGSSKSSGRLELAQAPTAEGKLSAHFLAAWSNRPEVTP